VTGTLIQTGGTLVTAGDLYLGDDSDDRGEYRISGGSMEVMDDLKLGDDGEGLLVLSGSGSLTVHGYAAITNKGAPSAGLFEISGGTFTQDGTGTSGSGNQRFTVADAGPATLKIIGDAATINVTNYEQNADGTLELVLAGGGISTINASGNVTLDGTLDVSLDPGFTPTTNLFDLFVAGGALTGNFSTVNPLPPEYNLILGSQGLQLEYTGELKQPDDNIIPEPVTIVLMGLALPGLAAYARRKRRAH
jgi:hypothetical protein